MDAMVLLLRDWVSLLRLLESRACLGDLQLSPWQRKVGLVHGHQERDISARLRGHWPRQRGSRLVYLGLALSDLAYTADVVEEKSWVGRSLPDCNHVSCPFHFSTLSLLVLTSATVGL